MGQTCERLAHETKYSQVTLTSRGWFKSSSLAILAVIMLVNIPSAHWSQSCRLSRQRDSVRGATTEVSFLSHMSLYLPMPGTSTFLKPHPSHLSFPGWECVKSNYIICLHVSMRKGMNVCVTCAMHETWQSWYCHFHPVMVISYLLEVVTQWRDFLNYLFSDILQPWGEQVLSQRS